MEITKKQIEEIKIIGTEGLDPITVYIDERKDEEYKGQNEKDVRYKGRITILCYGLALNYFWGAMGVDLIKNWQIEEVKDNAG